MQTLIYYLGLLENEQVSITWKTNVFLVYILRFSEKKKQDKMAMEQVRFRHSIDLKHMGSHSYIIQCLMIGICYG